SVKLSPSRGKPFHGYLSRANQEGTALLELLADKKAHRVIVALRYPSGAGQDSSVEVLRLVQNSWRQLSDEARKEGVQLKSGGEGDEAGKSPKPTSSATAQPADR
ncbi:MAG: hypothetical protein DRI90_23470, partial [Deltaproteobacteria bacterium]